MNRRVRTRRGSRDPDGAFSPPSDRKINQLITADRDMCNITIDQVIDVHVLSLSLFHIVLAEIIFKPF